MEELFSSVRKTVIIVVDSLGVGPLPDSRSYSKNQRNTLSGVSQDIEKLNIPYLSLLGMSNITYIKGANRHHETIGFYGKIQPISAGLEKLIAYWEMTGIITQIIPSTFMGELPKEILHEFRQSTGKDFIGACYAPIHHTIYHEFDEHLETKKPIINVSPEGSLQIAAHVDAIYPEELYKLCFSLRRICDTHRIMRLTAKPFSGDQAPLLIKEKEKVFSMPVPQPGILDALSIRDIPVYTIGSISDFFNEIGVRENYKTKSYTQSLEASIELLKKKSEDDLSKEIIFVEYGFDYYDHKIEMDKTIAYAAFLEDLDSFLPRFISVMHSRDILIILGDQASDPTQDEHVFTREYIPILIFSKFFKPYDIGYIGIRKTLADLALSLAEMYGFNMPYSEGESFWHKVSSQI